MKTYPKYIAVEKIAKRMNFRIDRILQKIEKMQLKLTKSRKLNSQDATFLINSFLCSKKTSPQTKRNAVLMLKELNNSALNPNSSSSEFIGLMGKNNSLVSKNL